MKKIMRNLLIAMIIFSLSCLGGQSLSAEASTTKAPAQVTIKSANANLSEGTITVRWKRVKHASGYQIAYKKSSAPEYKKIKITGNKTNTKKLALNSKKSSYRILVRAYRKVKVNGKTKTYLGKWSKVEVVKQYVPKPVSVPKPVPTPTPAPKPTPNPSYGNGNSGNNIPSYSQPTVPGDNNGASSGSGTYVWIPRTGTKYHKWSTCSGMKGPTQVTVSEAESRGYTPCKKCY